jgi:prephenate dehydrogenase
MNSAKPTVVIVGLGLLGASFAAALKKEKAEVTLIGISSPDTIQKALADGIVDYAYTYHQIDEWKSQADIILLSTPIQHIEQFLNQLKMSPSPFKKNALITDVGSTKNHICTLADQLFLNHPQNVLFVGGHPMAGSEKRGLDSRDIQLYESALWILCPPAQITPAQNLQLELLKKLIQVVGSRIIEIPADLHDAHVAKISHLPQLMSTLLAVNTLRKAPHAVDISGPGFRDMTRLAASSFSIWKDILQTNTSEITQALESFSQLVDELLFALNNNDYNHVETLFSEGQTLRSTVQIPGKGYSYGLTDVIAHIQDKPKMMQKIVSLLSDSNLDIRDIELLKVREGSGGTLRLAFKSATEADSALNVLTQNGIYARRRS